MCACLLPSESRRLNRSCISSGFVRQHLGVPGGPGRLPGQRAAAAPVPAAGPVPRQRAAARGGRGGAAARQLLRARPRPARRRRLHLLGALHRAGAPPVTGCAVSGFMWWVALPRDKFCRALLCCLQTQCSHGWITLCKEARVSSYSVVGWGCGRTCFSRICRQPPHAVSEDCVFGAPLIVTQARKRVQ